MRTRSKARIQRKLHFVLIIFFCQLFCFPLCAQTYEWAKVIFPQSNSGYKLTLTVDQAGNTYTVGKFTGMFDADPGPGTHDLVSEGLIDVYITKYDANGNLVWALSFGGAGDDYGTDIVVDQSGNVYVSGFFKSTVDFDPGPGTTLLSADAGGDWDGYICKYSSTGAFIWARSIGNSSADYGPETVNSIDVDDTGNVYALGAFPKPVDVDPGPGIVILNPTVNNIDNVFLLKLDQNGDYVHAIKINYNAGSSDGPVELVVRNGVIYTCIHGGAGYYIAKFDSGLNLLWTELTRGETTSMAIDAMGNIIIGGYFVGTVDFDPGPGIHYQSAPFSNLFDMFVCKLNTDGEFQWVRTMGSISQQGEFVWGVVTDQQNGDIYLTGIEDRPVYFDGINPAGYFQPQASDAFVEKLSADGSFKWVVQLAGPGNSEGRAIATDGQGNVFINGTFDGLTDFNPDPLVADTQSAPAVMTGYYTWKLSPGNVVPVKLTNFIIKKQTASIMIYWTTEQEINSKSFVIERSLDGIKWNEITRLNAAGNSSVKINYNATDYNPAKGINYYRLKQLDLDGRFNYSEIRSVYFGNDVNVVVAPNPAKDKVTVYLPGNSSMISIKIFNENGQLVKEVFSIDESVQVNLSSFAKGIYTIKLNGKNINEARKLFVD